MGWWFLDLVGEVDAPLAMIADMGTIGNHPAVPQALREFLLAQAQ